MLDKMNVTVVETDGLMDLIEERDNLLKQRDELLGALKQLVKAALPSNCATLKIDMAQAAIAKAEGGAA